MADTDRLYEIKARAAAATPGPWKPTTDICDCGWDYACGHGSFIDGLELPDPKIERKNGAYESYDYLYSEFIDFSHGTRDFLAHSRADVDWLVAEVERLRNENVTVAEELAHLAREDRADVSAEDMLIAVGGDLKYHRTEVERLRAEVNSKRCPCREEGIL